MNENLQNFEEFVFPKLIPELANNENLLSVEKDNQRIRIILDRNAAEYDFANEVGKLIKNYYSETGTKGLKVIHGKPALDANSSIVFEFTLYLGTAYLLEYDGVILNAVTLANANENKPDERHDGEDLYNMTFARFGSAQVWAEDKDTAWKKGRALELDDIDWSESDWDISDCSKAD